MVSSRNEIHTMLRWAIEVGDAAGAATALRPDGDLGFRCDINHLSSGLARQRRQQGRNHAVGRPIHSRVAHLLLQNLIFAVRRPGFRSPLLRPLPLRLQPLQALQLLPLPLLLLGVRRQRARPRERRRGAVRKRGEHVDRRRPKEAPLLRLHPGAPAQGEAEAELSLAELPHLGLRQLLSATTAEAPQEIPRAARYPSRNLFLHRQWHKEHWLPRTQPMLVLTNALDQSSDFAPCAPAETSSTRSNKGCYRKPNF